VEQSVGIVGLGALGLAMGRRLIERGVPVVGTDASPSRREMAAATGMEVRDTAVDTARDVRFCLVVVRTGDQVRQVLTGPDGLVNSGDQRTCAVITSTVGPREARELQRFASAHGLRLLDAPVSGGAPGAAAGTLTVLLSGPAEDRLPAADLLAHVAREVVDLGDECGTAQAAKIATQVMLGFAIQGAAEATRLAVRLGLDADRFLTLAAHTDGRSWATDHPDVLRAMWDGEHGARPIDLICKDLDLAREAAVAMSVDIPASATVRSLISAAGPWDA
jgi:3-hydroxyisobutyrate dehydrogenase-like beta-hydroxyacid dehydrogenase